MGRCGLGSWIVLAGVEDGDHLDGVRQYPIDQNIIGVDHRLARAGHPTGAVDVGMLRQALGGVADQGGQALRCQRIALADEGGDVEQVMARLGAPDQPQHQRRACPSRTAWRSAIT